VWHDQDWVNSQCAAVAHDTSSIDNEYVGGCAHSQSLRQLAIEVPVSRKVKPGLLRVFTYFYQRFVGIRLDQQKSNFLVEAVI
jgi:hypothetical protein